MPEAALAPRSDDRASVRLAVVQHEPATGLGAFAGLLEEAGAGCDVVATSGCESLPEAAALDGAIVLGGSLGAHDPTMLATQCWIRDAALRAVPLFGICLGAQLIASALGGSVRRAPRPQAGVHDVFLLDAARHDPLFGGLPRCFPVFGCHEDAFEPPPGAIPLAASSTDGHQAFRWGGTAYGLQFHPEVRAEDLGRWRAVAGYRNLLARAEMDWHSTARSLELATPELDMLAGHLLDRWLYLVARRRMRTKLTGGVRMGPGSRRVEPAAPAIGGERVQPWHPVG